VLLVLVSTPYLHNREIVYSGHYLLPFFIWSIISHDRKCTLTFLKISVNCAAVESYLLQKNSGRHEL
jgi:hypothetical protein